MAGPKKMEPRDRRRALERLFDDALQRAPDERAAFLDEACAGDDELRRELEQLLAHADTDSWLGDPANLASTPESPGSGPAMDVPGPGGRVDRYELIRRLGAGGMGTVFLAWDTELHRQVDSEVGRGVVTTNTRPGGEVTRHSPENEPNTGRTGPSGEKATITDPLRATSQPASDA